MAEPVAPDGGRDSLGGHFAFSALLRRPSCPDLARGCCRGTDCAPLTGEAEAKKAPAQRKKLSSPEVTLPFFLGSRLSLMN